MWTSTSTDLSNGHADFEFWKQFIYLLIYLLSSHIAEVVVSYARLVAEINCNRPNVELKLFTKRNIKSIMRTTIATKTINQKSRTSKTFPESVPARPPGERLVSRVAKLVKADLAVFGSLSPYTYTHPDTNPKSHIVSILFHLKKENLMGRSPLQLLSL